MYLEILTSSFLKLKEQGTKCYLLHNVIVLKQIEQKVVPILWGVELFLRLWRAMVMFNLLIV